MLTTAPKCRAVCNGKPGDVMDELVAGFKALRAQGVSERDALEISKNPLRVMCLFPSGSLGTFHSAAEAFVSSGCATCAVNLAYAPPADKSAN